MLRAVLFKSKERFTRFLHTLEEYGVACDVLDFADYEWIDYDFSNIDFIWSIQNITSKLKTNTRKRP